ncbi:MAG: GAF domain-containing protein [Chromatiales bacterium]
MRTSSTLKSVAQDWLAFQCRQLPAVSNAVVVLDEPGKDTFMPAASWSGGAAATPLLADTVKLALTRRQPVVGRVPSAQPGETHHIDIAALPLLVQGQLLGAVAFEVTPRPDLQQRALVSILQFGVSWLEFLLQQSGERRAQYLERILALVAVTMQPDNLKASATAMVTALATQLGCERVSVGLRSRGHCRALALSHSARFDARANLLRDIETAMDEALDQNAVLSHPHADETKPCITAAQRELSRQHGGHAVLAVPLVVQGRLVGAITLERTADRPFDAATVELCAEAARFIGPLIECKRLASQSLLQRSERAAVDLWLRLAGRGHHAFKLLALLLAGAGIWLATASGMHQIASPAVLEGSVQRVIVAPRDGYVGTVHAAAGDVVQEKEVLATLEDKDLQLERLKWKSQKEQLEKKYREVLALKDRAQITILEAQIAQADAQLALIGEQLARGQLVAPFAGVVVAGDLTHSLGAPVKRGEILFEVAPLDSYRVIVEVDERAIAATAPGQQGRLILTALPQQLLPFTVEKVTPVASAAEGRNSFRLEARLDRKLPLLRPGMRGVARIDVGERRRLWIWTHTLLDWLRLKTWSLL